MQFGNRDEMILECGWWEGQIVAGQLSQADLQKGRQRQAFLRATLQWPPTYVIPNYNPKPTPDVVVPDPPPADPVPADPVPTDGGEDV